MIIKGHVLKYGDNINTDLIYPGKYLYTVTEEKEMVKHAFEDLDKKFLEKAKGKILVAGENFGCGSSRDQAVQVIKLAGIRAIIASSFARIFYRNAINFGLLAIECPQLVKDVKEDDMLEINMTNNKIVLKEKEYDFPKIPEFVMNIFKAGGLIPYIKKKIK